MNGIVGLLVLTLLSLSLKADIKPYGTLRVDTVRDSAGSLDGTLNSSSTSTGDSSSYVSGIDDNISTMHIRGSQLGVAANQSFENFDLNGKIDVDFFGESSRNNAIAAEPRLRDAHMNYTCKMTGLNLLVGQAKDIIAPYVPSTFNDSSNAMSGNLGDYRPQAALSYELFKLVKFQASAAKPHSARETSGTFDKSGRLSLDTHEMFGSFSAAAGYGYVDGKDLRDDGSSKKNVKNIVQANVLDWKLGFMGFVTKGEYYKGKNVLDYGGLGGYDSRYLTSMEEKGWWADLGYEGEKFGASLGASWAEVESPVHPAVNRLTENTRKWINVTWNCAKDFKTGFEYSTLRSTWGQPNMPATGQILGLKSERYNLMFSYSF